MEFQFSDIGRRLSGHSGINELMDDLGHALSGAHGEMFMMGGGNPAHIPAVQAVWRARLAEIVGDAGECDRMLTNYDPPAGNGRFREAVAACLARTYGWPLTAKNVAVTCGGQSAFFLLFNLLAGRTGGETRRILLPLVPEYIGYADQGLAESMFASRRPRIEMCGEHAFKYHIDFDALGLEGPSSGDDIAAIAVSRPTNPSGNVLTDDEVARLDELANRRGIPLVIDNAYGAPFPGAVFERIQPVWDPGVILTFSLSKLGLPGVRTGIVVADEDIVRRIASMTAIVGLANTNVGQTMVRPLLESGELVRLSREVIQPFYLEKSRAAAAAVRAEFGESFPYAIHRSEGAFFLWLWFPDLPITTRELYQRLKARGVLIVPGEYFFFGLDGGDPWPHASQCVRMTFSQAADTVARGVALMADELRRVHAGAR
jgi:valine--pyruvate aminotransferase